MRRRSPIRFTRASGAAALAMLALSLGAAVAQQPAPASPVVLDRVEAVVNNRVILASDLDREVRLSVLDPSRGARSAQTRQSALQLLISRSLIQQQIRQEDVQAIAPTQAELDSRLAELRRELPACVHQNCASDAGWKAFLAANDLTPREVATYLRNRIEILRFIEQRFSQGIQITPQEIEAYYKETLLPQYSPGEAVPSLDKVSSRIQEILLQQQVNALFSDWLQNLRKQGDVEILDPAYTASAPSGGKAPSGDKRGGAQ